MALFHIYGDESGKLSSKAERTSFCGYVAHVSHWQVFSQFWNDCRMKWGVPPIHMSRIMSPGNKDDAWKKVKDHWGTAWEKKRDLMLGELSQLIFDSKLVCVGAVVDAKRFREICDEDPQFKKAHRDPIHMAFHTFAMRGFDKIEVIDKHSPVGIVIDEDKEFAMGCYEQLVTLKQDLDIEIAKTIDEETKDKFKRIKARLHAVTFASDDSYPGLQAADMIAYEARRAMVVRMTDPNYTSELYDNLTFARTHQPHYYTKEVLDGLHAELKKGIADGSITL